jgi:hypothetical protein
LGRITQKPQLINLGAVGPSREATPLAGFDQPLLDQLPAGREGAGQGNGGREFQGEVSDQERERIAEPVLIEGRQANQTLQIKSTIRQL